MTARRRSPTARHRRLVAELRGLREASAKSRQEVAELVGTTDITLWRYETGLTRPAPADVAALLEVYGVAGEARGELLEMAREARKRGWWHRHRQTLKPGFDSYIGLEAEASVLRTYQPQVVPGLLQTEAYARAVIEATAMRSGLAEVEEKVAVRMSRQDLVTRAGDPIQIVVVLDEAVIRRQVGGPGVMRGQLRHLLEAGALPNVDIRILSFGSGAHSALDGQFNLLEFPEPGDLDLVYLEQAASGLVLEEPQERRRYASMFADLLGRALSPGETAILISSVAEIKG
ncbi:helix-turn-helix transcriptional regulator [Sphaerisporangium sp. NPDC049002]|uniref:helix-turn-helix domain-containing protein n=1 Tax=unclassified Sphaerisporangium TaxID=2630420 RepID=UPI0033E4EDF2